MSLDGLVELLDKLRREIGEVVDEVQRVLDLMRDTSGELTQGGELLSLNEAVLRSAELLERAAELARPRLHLLKERTFLIAMAAWSANVETSSICFSVKGRGS